MQQWEYRDNKKILDRFKVKVEAAVEEHKQVECTVTESDVVMDLKHPIEIPITCIKRCDIYHTFPSYSYPPRVQEPLSDDATLTYLDNLKRKHKVKFKIMGGVEHLSLKSDPESYKEFHRKSLIIPAYSLKALQKIREALPIVDLDHIWQEYCISHKLYSYRKYL